MNVSIQAFKDNQVMESEQKQELKTSGLNPHFSNRQNLGEIIYINKDCEKQVP